jgi:hypothetical protein
MRIPALRVVMVLGLVSCVRSPSSTPVPEGNDTTIRFSRLFETSSTVLSEGASVELDGPALRALMIAANDYTPPGGKDRPCEYRQEAQRYRILRQEDVFLVYVYEDTAYCGLPHPTMDSGAKYAISMDGRILRRVFDGQPEDPTEPLGLDAGGWGPPSRPGIDPGFDARWNKPGAGPLPDGGGDAPPPRGVPDGG